MATYSISGGNHTYTGNNTIYAGNGNVGVTNIGNAKLILGGGKDTVSVTGSAGSE